MRVFIDSNIPMYLAGRDHPNKEPALRFIERVRAGELEGCTSTEVLQEILYRYSALQRRDVGFTVYDAFCQLCSVVFPVTIADTDRARQLLGKHSSSGVRDAIHAAVALNNEVSTIASFDRGFELIDAIELIELP